MNLSPAQQDLLELIGRRRVYTLARFELRCAKEPGVASTALNHVHLEHENVTMEQAKELACLLKGLEELGLVCLSYRLFVTAKSDYAVYYNSGLFRQLCRLVEEGRQRPGFLFDTPWIKRGAARLTKKGWAALR